MAIVQISILLVSFPLNVDPSCPLDIGRSRLHIKFQQNGASMAVLMIQPIFPVRLSKAPNEAQ